MNVKLFLKTIFLILMLLLLVLIGVYNSKETVAFSLPGILPHAVRKPAALMYFGFFAIGLLTGTILAAGGSHKGGAGGGAKPAKTAK
jgi:uncharacterized integral membrane protein